MSGIVDTYITYRIITTLTKPWKEQDAYEFGIIDDKGKVLSKSLANLSKILISFIIFSK